MPGSDYWDNNSSYEIVKIQIIDTQSHFQALVSKERKFNDDVLQNIVYKTFTTKVDVLNCYGPDLVKHLEESVKSWNINSPEYSAWAYLLQICCQEVSADLLS